MVDLLPLGLCSDLSNSSLLSHGSIASSAIVERPHPQSSKYNNSSTTYCIALLCAQSGADIDKRAVVQKAVLRLITAYLRPRKNDDSVQQIGTSATVSMR